MKILVSHSRIAPQSTTFNSANHKEIPPIGFSNKIVTIAAKYAEPGSVLRASGLHHLTESS